MTLSTKTAGETISALNDLSKVGYGADGKILLSNYSTANANSKFLHQTTNTTCDTTFIKEGNNSINQVSAKSAMNQISMKNLFGLRNKMWCGMVPDEQNVAAGPGDKFSGTNVNCVEIPAGVSVIDTFLVGGGGGGGGRDSDMHGGAGGSGCVVSTLCDLTPFGNLDKPRRIITVAGGGGYFGNSGSNVGGLPGSGLAMVDQDPGPGWGEMQNVCVSFPYNYQTDTRLGLHGWSIDGYVEFNIILYFYGDLAKKQNYYFKGRADDLAKVFDVTVPANATKLNAGDVANSILSVDITDTKVNTMTRWVVEGNGPNVSSNIRVLRVLLANTGSNSPSHFSFKLYDDSGNEVWNTRKRDGIGFLNFPHQGGRGGTSGRRGTSGGGGGGGGASFVAIESPANSGNISLVAIAGGGGGGAGYGNSGPSLLADSREAQMNYQYIPVLKDNTWLLTQASALYSVSPYGQAADPNYTLQYTDATVTLVPYGGAGDFDYGGAGGGGGGGGKAGSLYVYADANGTPVSWTGVSSTGGSNGISGTWTKNLYNDRICIGDTNIPFSYYPSVTDGATAITKYNFGNALVAPKYTMPIQIANGVITNTPLWSSGTVLLDRYKNTPGMGGQRTEAATIQHDGNMGFAYVEWDAGLQYTSTKSWKLYMDGMQNGIAYASMTKQTGTLTTTLWFTSPDIPTNSDGFSITVTKQAGDSITITPTPGYRHAVNISASSTSYPKITSGTIQVIANYNNEVKTFYFAYLLEWRLEYSGNAGVTYILNVPVPVPTEEHG